MLLFFFFFFFCFSPITPPSLAVMSMPLPVMWHGTAALNEALAFSVSFTREGVGQQLADGCCALLL